MHKTEIFSAGSRLFVEKDAIAECVADNRLRQQPRCALR